MYIYYIYGVNLQKISDFTNGLSFSHGKLGIFKNMNVWYTWNDIPIVNK